MEVCVHCTAKCRSCLGTTSSIQVPITIDISWKCKWREMLVQIVMAHNPVMAVNHPCCVSGDNAKLLPKWWHETIKDIHYANHRHKVSLLSARIPLSPNMLHPTQLLHNFISRDTYLYIRNMSRKLYNIYLWFECLYLQTLPLLFIKHTALLLVCT